MTGIEAVSNGTPLFRPPCEVGGRRTLAAIVTSLVALLIGITVLARAYGVTATAPGQPGYESLLSRLAAAVVGRGAFYYVTIGSVVTVLMFSANTSFAGFPRVCRMLAADRFLPEPFVHRGRRLTFSHGGADAEMGRRRPQGHVLRHRLRGRGDRGAGLDGRP
jgi:amino acid transporter